MRANPLVGLAIAFAACLLVPAAHAQDVGDCPDNTCVESQTSLVYNPQTNTMDAYTSATTDYNTSYWYDLCVNLAIVRLNGPYFANETVLLPSHTPPICYSAVPEMDDEGSVAATPGR